MTLDILIVRRAIYDAACKLENHNKTDDRDLVAFNLAEEKRDLCRAKDEHEEADFWHEVFEYLMTLESVSAGTPVKIID